MNIYGFTRITDGADKNCYFHEHFIRGQEHLLPRIIRVPTKKDAVSPSRGLTQLPDFEMKPDGNDAVPDTSVSEAYARIPPTMLNYSNQYRPGNFQSVSDLERHIEQLRRTNLEYIRQAIQLQDATQCYRDSLLNSPPTTMTSNNGLLLQMMQSRTSLPMASELALALSQFAAPVAASLPQLPNANSEWLRQQLNPASMTSVTLAPMHSNQTLSSSLQSDLRARLASSLQQVEPLNQSLDLLLDPIQLRYLDPLLISQLPSLTGTNIQNRIQLNRYNDERRRDTMSLLPNGGVDAT